MLSGSGRTSRPTMWSALRAGVERRGTRCATSGTWPGRTRCRGAGVATSRTRVPWPPPYSPSQESRSVEVDEKSVGVHVLGVLRDRFGIPHGPGQHGSAEGAGDVGQEHSVRAATEPVVQLVDLAQQGLAFDAGKHRHLRAGSDHLAQGLLVHRGPDPEARLLDGLEHAGVVDGLGRVALLPSLADDRAPLEVARVLGPGGV